jgi:UDP-2,3-diacylglucosamine pyrophosphatase LpxH
VEAPSEIKLVLSDLHMGTGERPGLVNPYEDFHFDSRLAELICHYATGIHAKMPIELILNGDILDLLKVPVRGRFVTAVDENIAVDKVRRCILGHSQVFDAMADFLKVLDHTITYIPGNHDPEIAFPLVQQLIRARLGAVASPTRLRFIIDEEFLRLPRGVVITHGHLFETINRIETGRMFEDAPDGRRILNLPYGSRFFTEVLAPVKAEQPLIDLVHPLSSMVLWGLVFEIGFTIRLLGRMARWFLTTRIRRQAREVGLLRTLQVLVDEIVLFTGMDRRAKVFLNDAPDVSALIVGHSHTPMIRRLPKNKVYVNTGTWVRMVSMDIRNLGTSVDPMFARVEYRPLGPPAVSLLRWNGKPRNTEEVVA